MRHYQRYHVHQTPYGTQFSRGYEEDIPINSDLFPRPPTSSSNSNLTIDSQPHRRHRHRISRTSRSRNGFRNIFIKSHDSPTEIPDIHTRLSTLENILKKPIILLRLITSCTGRTSVVSGSNKRNIGKEDVRTEY